MALHSPIFPPPIFSHVRYYFSSLAQWVAIFLAMSRFPKGYTRHLSLGEHGKHIISVLSGSLSNEQLNHVKKQ